MLGTMSRLADKRPLPVNVLLDARHDTVHVNKPGGRLIRATRIAFPGRPGGYRCSECGERGHNARSKSCGMTPEQRAEAQRVAAKVRAGMKP